MKKYMEPLSVDSQHIFGKVYVPFPKKIPKVVNDMANGIPHPKRRYQGKEDLRENWSAIFIQMEARTMFRK